MPTTLGNEPDCAGLLIASDNNRAVQPVLGMRRMGLWSVQRWTGYARLPSAAQMAEGGYVVSRGEGTESPPLWAAQAGP